MSLTVITGSMFAGKSKKLIELGKEQEGKAVLFIKPAVDNRYSVDEIVTHDGESVRAMVIDSDTQLNIADFFTILGANVVLIDEAQFFTTDLIDMVASMLEEEDKKVYVAGLNYDYKGKEFETTAKLIELADEVIELTAECADCKGEATLTAKTSGSDKRVELGSKDIYKPVCVKCFKHVKGVGFNE